MAARKLQRRCRPLLRPSSPAAFSHERPRISLHGHSRAGSRRVRPRQRRRPDVDPIGTFHAVTENTSSDANSYTDNTVEPDTQYGY